MKNPSPFPMNSKLVLLGSLLLLVAGIYFGGVQILSEKQVLTEPNQTALSLSKGTPVEFVSQEDGSASIDSDLVARYTQLYGKYQVKVYANRQFSIPTDQEIEALRMESNELDQLYTQMTLEERGKVKRVSFPYAKLEVAGKVIYKKFKDLTQKEIESLGC